MDVEVLEMVEYSLHVTRLLFIHSFIHFPDIIYHPYVTDAALGLENDTYQDRQGPRCHGAKLLIGSFMKHFDICKQLYETVNFKIRVRSLKRMEKCETL